ncbi:hypothetical protein [Kitasatospora sp. NPDC091207]|uniref:hypothetical protein n=1 Tax=Kitasatospora sp. NPDC091207 TaxID=3364083 RepID=UPI003805C677
MCLVEGQLRPVPGSTSARISTKPSKASETLAPGQCRLRDSSSRARLKDHGPARSRSALM